MIEAILGAVIIILTLLIIIVVCGDENMANWIDELNDNVRNDKNRMSHYRNNLSINF